MQVCTCGECVFKTKEIRDNLRNFLNKNHIETRTAFPPVHQMPMYKKKINQNLLKNTNILSETGICLPSGTIIKKKEITKICNIINNFLSKF